MTGYVSQLITRHADVSENVVPRLAGKFEPLISQTQTSETPGEVVEQNDISAQVTTAPVVNTFQNSNAEKSGNNDLTPLAEPLTTSDIVNIPATNILVNENSKVTHTDTERSAEKKGADHPIVSDLAKPSPVHIIESPMFIEQKKEVSNNIIVTPRPGEKFKHNADNNDVNFLLKIENVDSLPKESRNEPISFPAANAFPEMHDRSRRNGDLHIQPPSRTAAPTIKISIGRIEVKAVNTPGPSRQSGAGQQKPKLSLEDYLRKRNGNGQ